VYNLDSGRYEVAADSTGAPEDGIRLKLYAVDPVLHQPITPLDDIGYLDLTDESSPSADALGVLAVVQGVTYLDYLASAVLTTGSVTFSEMSVAHDGQTVTMAVTGSDAALSGTVKHNDNVVVTISGTPQQPVFTDAAGNELTNQDLQALAALFASVGAILNGFDNLLFPAYLVFSVSILAGW
jgi:hypothetical protein